MTTLTARAKAIGDRPAYPVAIGVDAQFEPGMTYRQALIKDALSSAVGASWFKRPDVHDYADDAIALADAVLERLAAEETQP